MTQSSGRTLNYAILSVFALVAVTPLLLVAAQAVRFPDVSLATLGEAWERGSFARYLTNSVIVTIGVVVVAGLLSILAAYALGTLSPPGGGPLFYVFLIGLVVPTESIIVPLYYDLQSIGLDNTLAGLILPQIAQSISFGVFWMRAYFRSVPRSLVDAARTDGATGWTVLWRVLVPVGRPAILTMVVLVAMWTWNDFLLALVILNSAEELRTAPLGLSIFQGQHQTDYELLMAGALIIALPIVLLYIFTQRRFIAGMMAGALKE